MAFNTQTSEASSLSENNSYSQFLPIHYLLKVLCSEEEPGPNLFSPSFAIESNKNSTGGRPESFSRVLSWNMAASLSFTELPEDVHTHNIQKFLVPGEFHLFSSLQAREKRRSHQTSKCSSERRSSVETSGLFQRPVKRRERLQTRYFTDIQSGTSSSPSVHPSLSSSPPHLLLSLFLLLFSHHFLSFPLLTSSLHFSPPPLFFHSDSLLLFLRRSSACSCSASPFHPSLVLLLSLGARDEGRK